MSQEIEEIRRAFLAHPLALTTAGRRLAQTLWIAEHNRDHAIIRRWLIEDLAALATADARANQ